MQSGPSSASYQLLPNTAVDDTDVIVLPVPYEETVCGRRGTAQAPSAILSASTQLEYYEEDQAWSPMEHMRIAVLEPLAPHVGEEDAAFHARLAQAAASLPGADGSKLFIALGGEHSITPSLTAGRLRDPATILFLDAHADLRESYKGTRHSHACAAARLREEGHRLIMAGVRSLAAAEADRARTDAGIEVYTAAILGRDEEKGRLLDCVAAIRGPAWLSIDMDVFDPAVVPGVGTPQPGGLDWYAVVSILEAFLLLSEAVVLGMDIVELVPEPSEVSQVTAAKLMQKAISFWGKKRGFDRKPKSGSQTLVEYE
jgi:agmatinase